jgi:hypothetical protein
MKFPIVSSTTIAKSYLSASRRIRLRSGVTTSGFEGNSQNRDNTFSPDDNSFSNESRSSFEACP